MNILYSNIFIQYRSYPEVCGYHYVTSVQIRSFLWSVLSCIRTEYRKIRIRKNSVFGHFSRSVYFQSAYGPTSGSLTFYMCEMARSGKVKFYLKRSAQFYWGKWRIGVSLGTVWKWNSLSYNIAPSVPNSKIQILNLFNASSI